MIKTLRLRMILNIIHDQWVCGVSEPWCCISCINIELVCDAVTTGTAAPSLLLMRSNREACVRIPSKCQHLTNNRQEDLEI